MMIGVWSWWGLQVTEETTRERGIEGVGRGRERERGGKREGKSEGGRGGRERERERGEGEEGGNVEVLRVVEGYK